MMRDIRRADAVAAETEAGSAVYAAQVEVLFRQLPWALVANMLVSSLLSIALWPLVDHATLLSWLAAILLVTAARAGLGWRYGRRGGNTDARRWCMALLALTFLSGVAWGSAAPLFMLDAEPLRQLVVALSLVGMVAGAVTSLVAVRWAYPLYTIPVMLPVGVAMFFFGDHIHATMGVMVAVYVVVMLGIARRLHETVVESLRLRFSNDELTSDLETTWSQLRDESQTREQVEKAARESERRLRLHVAQTPLAVIDWDAEFKVVAWNPAAERIFGYSRQEALKRHAFELIVPITMREQVYLLWRDLLRRQGGARSTNDNLTRDGRTIVCEWYNTTLVDESGQVLGVTSLVQDVTERREAERQLERLANYDTLTGLPNRNLFHDRLSHAVEKARRRGQQLALLFVDLDDFKTVNDTLGHDAGDRMLRHAAEAIRGAMREEDTIARLGGDEFVVLMEEANPVDLPGSVRRLLDALEQPIILDGQELASSASIGIAVYPADGEDIPTLLKSADTAMYRAKEQGERYQFFQAEMAVQARERLLIESNLRRAIEREQLFLNFQPIVDLASGELMGAEALLRWRHPELGMVPPDRFIPVAEASGLIGTLGEWVLRETCRQIRRWEDEGLSVPRIAINLSARQLRQRDLAESFAGILAEERVGAARIGVELTESALMHDPDAAAEMLCTLRAAGFEIYIDDFGTGYSSLSYLKRFPIDKLKIDRSFVNDLSASGGSLAIVTAVLGVARALGMRVVAEGIETEEQMGMLRANGCDMGQGYHIARPMMAADFAAWARAAKGVDLVASSSRVAR